MQRKCAPHELSESYGKYFIYFKVESLKKHFKWREKEKQTLQQKHLSAEIELVIITIKNSNEKNKQNKKNAYYKQKNQQALTFGCKLGRPYLPPCMMLRRKTMQFFGICMRLESNLFLQGKCKFPPLTVALNRSRQTRYLAL